MTREKVPAWQVQPGDVLSLFLKGQPAATKFRAEVITADAGVDCCMYVLCLTDRGLNVYQIPAADLLELDRPARPARPRKRLPDDGA